MRVENVIACLMKRYPPAKFTSHDPFRSLIATVLSQRTRDEVTDKVAGRLFVKYGNPEALSHADEEVVMDIIKEVGFFRVKAPRIIEIARIINNDLNGMVPSDMEKLLLLPGVGRKTANCVLVYGFGINAIPVDTHVHRISNRLGFVSTKTPDETEMELRMTLPKKYWKNINELLVRFGKDICRPLGPKCMECPVRDLCPAGKQAKSSE
jgi:endonuclease-3